MEPEIVRTTPRTREEFRKHSAEYWAIRTQYGAPLLAGTPLTVSRRDESVVELVEYPGVQFSPELFMPAILTDAEWEERQRGPRKNRLLILSCSARKTDAPGLIPALDRYDGQFFRIFKKALRDGYAQDVQLAILSARFGLLNTDTRIPDYDQPMTPKQCEAKKPRVQENLGIWLGDRRYDQIFVNLGKDYLPLVEGMPGLATATFASGQIGERAYQLKEWLRQPAQSVQPAQSNH